MEVKDAIQLVSRLDQASAELAIAGEREGSNSESKYRVHVARVERSSAIFAVLLALLGRMPKVEEIKEARGDALS